MSLNCDAMGPIQMDPATSYVASSTEKVQRFTKVNAPKIDTALKNPVLANFGSTIQQSIKKVTDSVGKLFSEIGKFFAAIPAAITGLFGMGLEKLAKELTPGKILHSGLKAAGDAAHNCMQRTFNFAGDVIRSAEKAADRVSEKTKQATDAVFNKAGAYKAAVEKKAGEFVQQLPETVKPMLQLGKSALTAAGPALYSRLSTAARTAFNERVEDAKAKVTGLAQRVHTALPTPLRNLADRAVAAVGSLFKSAAAIPGKVIGSVAGSLEKGAEKAKDDAVLQQAATKGAQLAKATANAAEEKRIEGEKELGDLKQKMEATLDQLRTSLSAKTA